jgi:hypothetical protein
MRRASGSNLGVWNLVGTGLAVLIEAKDLVVDCREGI